MLNEKTVNFLKARQYYNGEKPLMRESDKFIVDQVVESGAKNILDYGCGVGRYYSLLKDKVKGLEYTGFDIDSSMVDKAIKEHGEMFTENLEDLEERYEIILAVDTLRNIVNEDEAIALVDLLISKADKVIFHVWSNLQDVYNDVKMNGDVIHEKHYSDKTLAKIFNPKRLGNIEISEKFFEITPFHCKVISVGKFEKPKVKPEPKKATKKKSSKKDK